MASRVNRGRHVLNCFCLIVSGFGVGWLVGLSVSPVIQTILAAVITVVVSISASLAGLQTGGADSELDDSTDSREKVSRSRKLRKIAPNLLDPVPIMFMVVGLVCGASAGVYGRANNWLGTRSNKYVEEWKETGLSSKEITTRVFDLLYPPHDLENTRQETPPASATKTEENGQKAATASQSSEKPDTASAKQSSFREGVLFTMTLEQCKRLLNTEDEEELRREMASSNNERLVSLARICKSIECLRTGVKKACAKV